MPAGVDDASSSSASSSRERGSTRSRHWLGSAAAARWRLLRRARRRRTHPAARAVAANGDRLRRALQRGRPPGRRRRGRRRDPVRRPVREPGARALRRRAVGSDARRAGRRDRHGRGRRADLTASADGVRPCATGRPRPDAGHRGDLVGRGGRGVAAGGAAAADLAPQLQLAAAAGEPHRRRPRRAPAGHSRPGGRGPRDGRRVRRCRAPSARPAPPRRTSSRRLPASGPGDRHVRGRGPRRRGAGRRPAAGDARACRPAPELAAGTPGPSLDERLDERDHRIAMAEGERSTCDPSGRSTRRRSSPLGSQVSDTRPAGDRVHP